jgi:hypothetical protein
MLSVILVLVATLLALMATHGLARQVITGKISFTFNVSMGSSGYGGSSCNSNTYSGQCQSGDCTCYVSGIVPVKVVGSVQGRPAKSLVRAGELFITVDNGAATGTPGCSPSYGVMKGLNKKLAEVASVNIAATLCPQKKASGPFNLVGGWGLEPVGGFSAGGDASGTLNGNKLNLTLTGTGIAR